jgi:hypothetical protein
MGGACSIHRSGKNFMQDLVRKPERRDHLKDLGVDGRILLNVKRADAD